MTDHAHCYCFPVCLSETHITQGLDEKGKKKQFIQSKDVKDIMCCHCGSFKEKKLLFVQTEGHGILRHHTAYAPKEEGKK